MITIRFEKPEDHSDIAQLIRSSLKYDGSSRFREAELGERLREWGSKSLSLVAERFGFIVGYVSFSRVVVDGEFIDWYSLTPVSVVPEYRGLGIGSKLVSAGLDRLKARDARGCVLLADPGFYRRFGFIANHKLLLQDASAELPSENFQALPFACTVPAGVVEYPGLSAA